MHSEHDDLLEKIGERRLERRDPGGAAQGRSRDFADDFGYDLDEEGQPLDEREVGETTREQEGIRSSEGDGSATRATSEAAAEQEEEAAAPA